MTIMKRWLNCIHVVVLLGCCLLTLSTKESSTTGQTKSGPTMSPQNSPRMPSSRPTPTPSTTDQVSGTNDIPKFDFSVFANSKVEKKSAIADIPTIDFSKKSTPSPTAGFCKTNICDLMDGICIYNNSVCVSEDCLSFSCKCNPGYSGQFCYRNATDVIKAKEVPTVNGKIVTTETPPETTTNSKPQQKDIVNGTGKHRSVSNGTLSNEHDLTNPAEKYKQPKGSFVKGPEVPSPSSEKPIKINVKSQRIRGKSTTIIEHPSASVTIATVSVNLEQSLSGSVSGQTTKNQKKLNRKVSDSSLKSSKNVEKVFLSSGKVKIVDQSVGSLDITSVSKGKVIPSF